MIIQGEYEKACKQFVLNNKQHLTDNQCSILRTRLILMYLQISEIRLLDLLDFKQLSL